MNVIDPYQAAAQYYQPMVAGGFGTPFTASVFSSPFPNSSGDATMSPMFRATATTPQSDVSVLVGAVTKLVDLVGKLVTALMKSVEGVTTPAQTKPAATNQASGGLQGFIEQGSNFLENLGDVLGQAGDLFDKLPSPSNILQAGWHTITDLFGLGSKKVGDWVSDAVGGAKNFFKNIF